MAYATTADLIAAFGVQEVAQLTQTGADYVETPDEAVAAEAIAQAQGEIDSRLAVRYAVPVSPVPTVLRAACCDVARYRLYRDAAPDTVAARYEQALAWLADLAAGRAVLLSDAGATLALASTEQAARSGPVAVARTLVYSDDFQTVYAPGDGPAAGSW